MSTHPNQSATHPSRRYLHTSPLHDTQRGWEAGGPVPAIVLRDRNARERRRIHQRRRLALCLHLANLAAMTLIYFASGYAGANVMLIIPLTLVIWLPLWFGGLHLQANELFDRVQAPSWLPYLNFALIVAMPFAAFACIMTPFA